MLKWDPLEYTEGWDYKTKREARAFLNAVTSYDFSVIGLYRLLHPLAGITNRLQGGGVDITEAYVWQSIKCDKIYKKRKEKY